ncbi:sulfatase-like hydrolase/transferase [Membranihabitans maritimus]|uniref:sulfatase-like hydrolase/transferase n=1 Tax=Membranihabitans maritimus TaxID=2904244 RepID=UPI001F01FFED|nr:sulfatase-like hydrolase/transferase [Membranihabitans maritimus]
MRYLFACLFGVLLFHVSLISQEPSSPNIIFILTDDLGWGDLGTFFQNIRAENANDSEPWQLTPHLDAMARDGAMLTDHYCNAPVCAPSRSSFLLGVHQGHSNVRDNQFDKALEDNYTVANVLKSAGYETVAIGKWGLQGDNRWNENGDEWPAHPLNRGFDEFFGYMRHGDGHEHYPLEGIYRGQKEVYHNRENITEDLAKCYTGDLWTAFAKKWITDQKSSSPDHPFFMFLAYDTPHAVLELPTQAYPDGMGENGGLQWTGEPGRMINTASGKVDSWVHPDYKEAMYDHDKDTTTPMVPWPDTYKRFATVNRRIDNSIGDLLQMLKDLNIDENTMVVFTSDNGPSRESYLPKEEYVDYTPEFFQSFGPFDGIKRDCWEGGVRVPAIARMPGTVTGGQQISAPVMMSDWLATFSDLAGMEVPARSDGISLLPLLSGGSISDDHTVYVEYFNGGKTPEYDIFEDSHEGRKRGQMQLIRLGDYSGVRYNIGSHDDDFEIYNVVTDPKEVDNLADQQEFDDLQGKMKDAILRMRIKNESAKRPYDDIPVPSIQVNEEKLKDGVRINYYNASSSWIPKIENKDLIKGSALGTFEAFSRAKGNTVFISGYVKIEEPTLYHFKITTENQVLFRIHQALVIDGDYKSNMTTEKKGKIMLDRGFHPFTLYLKSEKREDIDFTIEWKYGDMTDYGIIPEDALKH